MSGAEGRFRERKGCRQASIWRSPWMPRPRVRDGDQWQDPDYLETLVAAGAPDHALSEGGSLSLMLDKNQSQLQLSAISS